MMRKTPRRLLIGLGAFILGLILTIVVGLKVIVPAMIKKKLTTTVDSTSHTEIHVEKVNLSMSGELILEEVTLKDLEKVAYIDRVKVNWSGKKDEHLIAHASLHHIKYRPLLDSLAFARAKPHQEDWISMELNQIELKGIDLNTFLKKQLLIVEEVTAKNAKILVYRDKTRPEAPYKLKQLPVSLLKDLPLRVHMKKVEVKGGYIQYSEKTEKHAGKVWFEDVYATFANVTNDSMTIKNNPKMTAAYQSKLLGKIKLQSDFDFYLNRKDDYFTVHGRLAPFKASDLDPAVYPMVGIAFKSGDFQRFEFWITGNNQEAEGRLEAEYTNLKIDVYTMKKNKVKKSFFKSTLANIVVRKNNIKGKKNYQVGKMKFDRRKDRFIFNYFWNVIKISLADVVVF